MRSERIVLVAPLLYDDPGFPEVIEDLSIKDFISKLPVETFAVPNFPRASGFNIEGSHPYIRKPLAHSLGNEF